MQHRPAYLESIGIKTDPGGLIIHSHEGHRTMLNKLFALAQDRLDKNRRYRQIVAEIDSLSNADLIELGAFQSDLYAAARRQVYG